MLYMRKLHMRKTNLFFRLFKNKKIDNNFKYSLPGSTFPTGLKHTYIKLMYEKNDKTST